MTAKRRNKSAVTTTVSLPITEKDEDQVILRALERAKVRHGVRTRTEVLRRLILADDEAASNGR